MTIRRPHPPQLYLASASPRRADLLGAIGVRFERVSGDVDETALPAETPRDYVGRLALAKARAGARRLGDARPARPVLGADTAVVIDDVILGKPRDRQHARAMLTRLSGREHRVMSAVAVIEDDRELSAVNVSRVRFRALDDDEIDAYWRCGEPADKAGGYGVQGLGATFVSEIRGSHSGVMGLPLFETAALLRRFGIDPLTADSAP